jgi:hypothetical protein
MRIADLPDSWLIAVDTETSKSHPDDGGHVAAVSLAFRPPGPDGEPDPSRLVARASPFDQGVNHTPLGPKLMTDRTRKRLSKWPEWALNEDAGNLPVHKFMELCAHLRRHRHSTCASG